MNSHAVLFITDTNLIGAVSEKSLNFIPSDSMKEKRYTYKEVAGQELQNSHSVQEWVDLINAWSVFSSAFHSL